MSGEGKRIDCDVHCAVPSPAALFPYLPEQWIEFMKNTEFKGPHAVGTTYPPWLPMVATSGSELTLERIGRDVLGGSNLAILSCYYGVESFTHPYFGPAVATAVNRWLAEQWLDRDERLLGSAVITPQHVPAAVAEIERIADDPRFVQVLVPARSPVPYGNQRFWPILEAAASHGLAVAITYGGATGTPPTPVNWLSSYWEEYVAASLNFQGHVLGLAVSGIFDRVPNLRVVVLESGFTWLPALLWRADLEWHAFQREVPWMDGAPSSYVRRFFRFTTAPVDAPPNARQLRQLVDQLGSQALLMYSSDYPHTYDSGQELLFDVLSAEEAERVRWSNAADCYGLEARLAGLGRRPEELVAP